MAKGTAGKLPGRFWNAGGCPVLITAVLAPMLTPIEAAPPDPDAVQKTLATIWEGVMPTTGTLALGYVMLLAMAGM